LQPGEKENSTGKEGGECENKSQERLQNEKKGGASYPTLEKGPARQEYNLGERSAFSVPKSERETLRERGGKN